MSEETKQNAALIPPNQKAVYHSYAQLYEKVMNEQISIDRAAIASRCLNGMTKTFLAEIHLAELTKKDIRNIEIKSFENI